MQLNKYQQIAIEAEKRTSVRSFLLGLVVGITILAALLFLPFPGLFIWPFIGKVFFEILLFGIFTLISLFRKRRWFPAGVLIPITIFMIYVLVRVLSSIMSTK